jgi:PAS fold
MRRLEGVGVLPATPGPTESWLEKYIHPDDRPHVTRAIRDAVRARSTFELEHRMRRAYGSWGRFVSRAISVLDQHGSRDRVVPDRPRRHHREGDRGPPEREQESHRGSGLLRVILRASV